ncbi:MAG: phenylalanine--tRNA ligase subunit beta [Clostridiales bacterium]|nr:phenylalanine--tRNA ligase subunit beta [Clostridiales bacterium]
MNWIQDYVNLEGLDIPELLKRFTLTTAEIDDVYEKGGEINDVVVGLILSVKPHPQSNKLTLLEVDTGEKVYSCVCGAPNVAAGIKVPFVKAGGAIVGGKVEAVQVAGCLSEGMCCSEKELGISEDHSGLMILDETLPAGADIKSIFPIGDVVFEVDNKSLTNRPDLWGHYGIAREFAAITGRELQALPQREPQYSGNERIPVLIERPDLCYRYSCLRMNNVTRRSSPVYMRIRLFYCGMRSLNYLADLTNYIMLEIGQPLHAFDAGKIANIVVRTYPDTKEFVTLDKSVRSIDSDTLMICNGDVPVAVAGIMGGLDSEIEEGTDSVLLEAANFDATSIRRSATRIGLRTDASMRYEKSLDPEMTMEGIRRFVYLMGEADSGAFSASVVTDVYPFHYPQIAIRFPKPYLDRYSGIDIPVEQISRTLKSLGFGLTQEGDEFNVIVPSWRATKDVSLKADLVEELTRVYGYDNFEQKPTNSLLRPVQDSASRTADRLFKDSLVLRHSLHEVHTYIWSDEKKLRSLGIAVEENVTVRNAAPDNNVLRNSILPSLLVAVSENKLYADAFGVFEIGKVVAGVEDDGLCIERRTLGIVLLSRDSEEEALYYQAAAIVNDLLLASKHRETTYRKKAPDHPWQHPKNTSAICCGGVELGTLCVLHPYNLDLLDKNSAVVCVEIDMQTVDGITPEQLTYSEPSRFPSIDYDLTVTLDDDSVYGKVRSILEAQEIPDLHSYQVADLYRRENRLNVTLRLRFSSPDRTLVREDVQARVDRLIEAWKRERIEIAGV